MSSPLWWGDWRPTLTPHTGNLLATDLIECTMIVGGLPVNTVITGAQILGAVPSGGGLTVGTTAIASGTIGRILFQGTGNVLQQSANLFWDNTNGRLGIGTASPSATLHSVGSITASGAIARGNYMQPTLVAAANNDVLVGLDISPTFTNGAFTGVQNVDLRTKNSGVVIGTGYGYGALYGYANDGILQIKDEGTSSLSGGTFATQIWLRPAGNAAGANSNYWSTIEHSFGGLFINSGRYASNLTLKAGRSGVNGNIYFNNAGSTMGMFFGGTGNFGLNTTTDAGYRLNVNGTARVQTSLEVAGASGITFGGGVSALAYSGSALYIGNSATWTDVRLFTGGVNKFSQTSTLTTISNTTINLATATVQLGSVNALTYSGTDIRIGSVSAGFNSLSMYVAGSERARIASTGNLLINTTTDVASSLLTLESTTKGFLPPRMTNAQMLAIAAPAAGLVVYDTTNNKHVGYDGTAWQNFY